MVLTHPEGYISHPETKSTMIVKASGNICQYMDQFGVDGHNDTCSIAIILGGKLVYAYITMILSRMVKIAGPAQIDASHQH